MGNVTRLDHYIIDHMTAKSKVENPIKVSPNVYRYIVQRKYGSKGKPANVNLTYNGKDVLQRR